MPALKDPFMEKLEATLAKSKKVSETLNDSIALCKQTQNDLSEIKDIKEHIDNQWNTYKANHDAKMKSIVSKIVPEDLPQITQAKYSWHTNYEVTEE